VRRRDLSVALCLAAAGCLTAPGGAEPDAGGGGVGGGGGGGVSRCQPFAQAGPIGEVAGTFVALEGVLAADLDGDGDRDLVLHGADPVGRRLVAVRMPQTDPLRYQWSMAIDGPVAVAAADLIGADGCAELVLAEAGAAATPFAVLGQEISGEEIFRELSRRELAIDATGGLFLVAAAGLGDGEPAVALATPTRLYALPPDALLSGEAVRTQTVPDFAGIRGIHLVPRKSRSELLVAESGRVRWMEPVLPGGQLQFSPRRVLTVDIDPLVAAAGADLDRDDEPDDLLVAGDGALGLLLDDGVDPATITTVPAELAPTCPPQAALAVGRVDGSGDADLVALDACAAAAAVSVLVDARVVSGPALEGAPRRDAEAADFAAVGLALADRDADGREEVWLFDASGAYRCLTSVTGDGLVACGG
jgi:hypothetical protein